MLVKYNNYKFELYNFNYIKTLYLKYELWIISNVSNKFINEIKYKYDLFNNFKGIITSESCGYRKPNSKIFQHALKVSNAIVYKSIFIDDSIINVKAAEEVGFNVHHYKTDERLKKYLISTLN